MQAPSVCTQVVKSDGLLRTINLHMNANLPVSTETTIFCFFYIISFTIQIHT